MQFFGTLTNKTGQDLFLNADNFNLSGLDASSIDDGPFFVNTPSGFLGPNESTGDIGLFNVTIPDPLAGGDYVGALQILGGTSLDDQDPIGAATFRLRVEGGTNAVPEPSFKPLLLAAVVLAFRARVSARRTQ